MSQIRVGRREPCSKAEAAAAIKLFLEQREGLTMSNSAAAPEMPNEDVMTNLRLLMESVEGPSNKNRITFSDDEGDDAASSMDL